MQSAAAGRGWRGCRRSGAGVLAADNVFFRAKEEGRILMDPAFWVKPLAMTYSCMA